MENTTTESSKMTTRVRLGEREIILVGTAHISQASVAEVETVIRQENPDTVCVELDKTRYTTLVENSTWKNIDISRVIREKKGFLLFANIILASFQRRLGLETGTKPGEEMVKAINVAKELGIGVEFCDREVQVTLRRAWAKSSFWGKNKMLAALITSIFTNEKIKPEDLEKLKEKNLMQSMLEELSRYLPKVKEVLIDERDRYLATKIFNVKAKKIVAVVGAGHVEGIVKFLELLEGNQAENDVTALEEVPQKHVARKILPWLVPLAVVGLFVIGFLTKGVDTSIHGLFVWVLATTIPVAVGGLLAFGHPLAILIGTVSAPVTALLPIVGAGVVSGLVQYKLRKPQVADFESLHDDINLFRRYYRNRVLKVLLVFIFENLGRLVGQIVGLSLLGSLLK